jgi:hypothetical protein
MGSRLASWATSRLTRIAQAVQPSIDRWADDEAVRLDRNLLEQAFLELQPDNRSSPATAVEGVEEVFATFTDKRASYMQSLHETKRRMALLRRLGVRHPWWDVNSKHGGYRFAEQIGLSAPQTFGRFARIADVDPSAYGDRFLIKPESGSTNRGVYGLDRQPNGILIDRINGGPTTWDQVAGAYVALVKAGKVSEAVMVEELLLKPGSADSIPDDFKLYCFYDRVELVMQRDMRKSSRHADWRFKFWDREWNELGPVKYADRVDESLRLPDDPAALIAAGELLGRHLRVPFCRLDFYDSDRGVVFGEVTLNPGPPEVFTPEVDEFLGRHREFAAARLLAEDVQAGHWDYLRPGPRNQDAS